MELTQTATAENQDSSTDYEIKRVFNSQINENKDLKKKLGSLGKSDFQEKGNEQAREIYSTEYDFTIDASNAMYLRSLSRNYHSYTFKIERENPEYLLENLILSYSDSLDLYHAYIQVYDINQDELTILERRENLDLYGKIFLYSIDGSEIINDYLGRQIYVEDTCPVIDYNPGQNCGCSGDHTFNEAVNSYGTSAQCCFFSFGSNNNTLTPPSYSISWESCGYYVDVGGGGGGGNSNGGGGDPPPNDYDGSDPTIHGNGGGVATSTNTGCRGPGCIEIEIEDPEEEDGCSKIENLLNETNYPDLKDELISLMGKTNLTQERGKFRTENATVNQNMPVGSDGSVEFDPLPSPYIFMAHTHNSPSNETYSVFSWEDLRAIYTLIKGNHIDNSQFVFFLFTADGTRLALTIDDPIKYRKFFGFNDDPLFELETGIKRNKAKLELFYAKDDEEPRIKEDNTDNDEDLKNILDLFQDNDLGVSLFSCNQDLTEFTELTHNTNTDDIDEDACE